MPTRTNQTTANIIKFLNYSNYFVWRNNTTGVWDPVKKVFRTNKTALKGVADIVGLRYDSTFIAVEIKTGRDKLSSDQETFKCNIENHNGIYIIAKDFDDFMKQFKEIGK